MSKVTLQSIAQAAYDQFETAERQHEATCGECPHVKQSPYVRIKDGAPSWIKDAVKDAHDGGDMLPDDFVYDTARAAFERIADTPETEDFDDAREEFADGTDVYNSDLLAWLASHATRVGYCDEVSAEFGNVGEGIMARVAAGQYHERGLIFDAVLNAVKAQQS